MTYDFGDVGEQRRETMRAIKSEGTEPERRAAGALDALGVGYEEQPSYGRYRPDFRLEDGTVLQIHGAFWHGHPSVRGMDEVETNEDYWTEKLRKNVNRDHRRRQKLLSEHNVPAVVWVWEPDPIEEHVHWHCRRLGLVPNTYEHRFWSKVDKAGFDDCWEWQAALDRGYGHFNTGRGDTDRASRVAYKLWYSNPGDKQVLHDCDNRKCCNPHHLHAGSHGDNMREAWERGRQHYGKDHGQSKLTVDEVRDIYERHSPYGRNGTSARQLAEEHNVSPDTIRHIVKDKTWTHITEDM